MQRFDTQSPSTLVEDDRGPLVLYSEYEKETQIIREKENWKGMTQGIAYCAGIFNRYYGQESLARELLSSSGIKSHAELIECGVDQFDRDNIGDLLPKESP